MLKSMTGYGRGQVTGGQWEISVEVKSVNHRYFEFSSKIPKAFLFLEDKLKSMVQSVCPRGKVELLCSIYASGSRETEVQVNEQVASGYLTALRAVSQKFGLVDDLKLSDLIRFNDIFTLKRMDVDEDQVWAEVQSAADLAISSFVSMKELEGARLKADIVSRLEEISRLLTLIEDRAPNLRQEYYDRLYAKIAEILVDKNIEETRLVTEAAVFAEKVAVDEETVRLRSHLHQFSALLDGDETVGRKLDFLVQELNRETNTIGSKAQDVEIARLVVDIKAEIEKIREQIQNVE